MSYMRTIPSLFDATKHIELYMYVSSARKFGRCNNFLAAVNYGIDSEKYSLIYKLLQYLTNYETTITNGISTGILVDPVVQIMAANVMTKLDRFVQGLLDYIT